MNPRFRPLLVSLIAWVLAFDLAWLWQRHTGAHHSEFGGHPDEAAHYVTGLMVRDYVAAGFPGHPMRYAEKYYAHYPKVGLGVWPPLFYVVQAAWTLPFGAGRTALMLLLCALTATVALLVFRALWREFSLALALTGAALFLALPLVHELSGMVMAEMLSALCMFAAALALGRFLDEEKARDALCFGALAGGAILTKGTGMALALVPPVAILLTQKWRVLARPALWGGAAICALLAGPWTYTFRNYGRDKGGWLAANPTWDFTREAAPYYAGKLGLALGVGLLIFFIIGLFQRVRHSRGGRGLWAAALALILSVLVFQSILPVGLEDRHLLPALPAVVLFIVAGASAIIDGWRRGRGEAAGLCQYGFARPSMREVVVVLLLGASAAWPHWFNQPPRKVWSGFAPLAEQFLELDLAGNAVVLVSSDARGEGMFISELAMRERRPGHVVKRASKEIAKMDWAGRGARPRFETSDDLANWFARAGIDYVLVDLSMPEEKREEHHDQLARAVDEHLERFWPVARARLIRDGVPQAEDLVLYRVKRTGP
jgi:hypothetical protein